MKTILKIISFLTGCCFVLLLAVGSYSKWFSVFMNDVPSPYRYGDLYLSSGMPGYRIKLDQSKLTSSIIDQNKNSTLTIIGDSYLDNLDPSFFYTADYHFIHWDRLPDTIPALDSTKKNILIIESTERYIRWRVKQNNLLAIGEKAKPNAQEVSGASIELQAEDNLQYMLTHLDWELPFKELKTSIYLNYFDKFSPLVAKPDGSGRLYLNETVDPENNASSYNPVKDDEIKSIVENINRISADLSALGFDVYISIIPNAASIYKNWDHPYNHLIERIEQHPDVKFKYIDIFQSLKDEKNSVFYTNDSHWNNFGKMMWLVKTNKLLKEVVR